MFADFIVSVQKAEYDEQFDDPTSQHKEEFTGQVILRPLSGSKPDYVGELAKCLRELAWRFSWTNIYFLLLRPSPWVSQENEFSKTKEAKSYFLECGITERFEGSIMLEGAEFPDFLPHLFWLTRSNMTLPRCYFTASDSKVVGTICQYGLLHFETYSEEEKECLIDNAPKCGLEEYSELNCVDQVDGKGTIEGRSFEI